MKKIKVLIIDDSALVREILTRLLSVNKDIEVVGTAMDPYYAVEKIKKYRPDVLTLDVEMPKMNGLDFLKRLMASHPMPVLMISSWTEANSETTIKALELGAVDFLAKPKSGLKSNMVKLQSELIAKVRAAASVNISNLSPKNISVKESNDSDRNKYKKERIQTTDKLIAIGASTGGTTAISNIVTRARASSSGMVIVQHMPEKFTAYFADSLNKKSAVNVKEAEDGERIIRGHAYIAPGNRHTLVVKSGAFYHIKLDDGPRFNNHRPSVDKTFFSIAENVGRNATGFILTGMGDDGAQGLMAMKEQGAKTFAQDEASSVIFGMPKAAIALGAAEKVLSLEDISEKVKEMR